MAKETPSLAELWAWLRTTDFLPIGAETIRNTAPPEMQILSVTHVRTGHYAAYKVETSENSWLVRVGLVSPSDSQPANNSAYLGTSTHSPTGQEREYTLARQFAASNVSVATPAHYAVTSPADAHGAAYDVLWLPFLQDSGVAVTAIQWFETLSPLHNHKSVVELPLFTNREKTMTRLRSFSDREAAAAFAEEYDAGLAHLFEVATQWGVVHGDAHCENILIFDGTPILFDFDTACWAPAVWDLTHLLSRVGTSGNTGYTADELKAVFPFTEEEIAAALRVRDVATRIARAVVTPNN